MTRVPDHEFDSAFCTFHNAGATLAGNTQGSDLEWFAHILFEHSRLGAGDVRTIPWLIDREQWRHLGLTPEALLGDGPRRFDMLTDDEKDAWRKLARICMFCLPIFAERVGHRFMQQAQAIRAIWKQERESEPGAKKPCRD